MEPGFLVRLKGTLTESNPMSRRLAVLLIGSLLVLAAAGSAWAEVDGQIVESGAFRLHLYKRPTGRETYEIRREAMV